MVTEEMVRIHHTDDEVVPPTAIQAFRNHDGMGALADAASEEATTGGDAGTKRSGDELDKQDAAAAKKPRHSCADSQVWNNLMAQVRSQLVAMTSDECISCAHELQMLARAEVVNRSQHLGDAMDLIVDNNNNNNDTTSLLAQAMGGDTVQPQPILKRENSVEPQQTMQHTVTTHAPVVTKPRDQDQQQQQQQQHTRIMKAEREVSKQKPINMTKAATVPCMKMTPPLPPRCEVDNAPNVELPVFCQLVNFPTARYYGNCVMCDESEFSVPKQNKGVCNNCDVAIWVVHPSGMQIKWCKGCKNFRKWIDFGMKGYSSKCDRCRQQQAARYATQKTKEEVCPAEHRPESSEHHAHHTDHHAVVNPAPEVIL